MIPTRLPNESTRAYAAFQEYCRLGTERSISKLWRLLGKNRVTLENWSVQNGWQERIKGYDDDQAKKRAEADDKEMRKRAAVWAKRQIEHRDKAFKLGEMLVREGTKRLKTIKTATLGDSVRAIQIGENIQRLCLGLATDKTEHSGPDNAPLVVQQSSPVVIVLEAKDE